MPPDPTVPRVGVGPAPKPWPTDPRYDPELLAAGDHRNVLDRYRYWTVEAIVADLDARRHSLHIAIQNWEHDFNIGSIVRTGNAFNVAGVHILGRHKWNRRGALVTDRYLHVHHQPDVESLVGYCAEHELTMIGVDNLPGSVRLETAELPERCCLVFGSEGQGLTDDLAAACEGLVAITQYGSTRSMNAGAAAAVAMYHWALQHAGGEADRGVTTAVGPIGLASGGAQSGSKPPLPGQLG
jgi:tRNA G18 (ribose-2'-O)-methylase SpoU